MINIFSTIYSHKMDRKDFLGVLFAGFLSVFGISAILKRITSYNNHVARQENPEISKYGKI